MIGISRREAQMRAVQDFEVDVARARADAETARADAETARAELLAGRNHLARELHDVLAHTLSALSLQLEALDALMAAGTRPEPAVLDQLERIKRLVREGLDEARGAVRALREDLPPLEERLRRLAADDRASLEVSGVGRPLTPEVSLALYRVAQEAVTNAIKHAPGAPISVQLDFGADRVRLSISDPGPVSRPAGDTPAAGPSIAGGTGGATGMTFDLAASGGGYGLAGIRERVLLVGGTVEAGQDGPGWLVEATVPA